VGSGANTSSSAKNESSRLHVRLPLSLLCDLAAGHFAGNEYKVLLAHVHDLYNFFPDRVGGYPTSRRAIAERTGVHERTVRTVEAALVDEGVLKVIKQAKGRRAAVVTLETNSAKWGKHSPAAPPRRQAVNPDNLTKAQFSAKDACGSQLAHNAGDYCGSQLAQPAGADSPTSCGSQLAHLREETTSREEAHDSGSSGEPPLSAPESREPSPERLADIRARSQRYLDDRRQREQQAVIARALGKEPAS
jgi:hypothetical protein